jgi:hypothetical protein
MRARAPSSARAGAKPRHRSALYGRMADGRRTAHRQRKFSAVRGTTSCSEIRRNHSPTQQPRVARGDETTRRKHPIPARYPIPHCAVRRRARDPTWQSCARSATQRDSHPPRPLCRLQRSGDSGLAMRSDFRVGIAAPAPKQIILRTHRPPSVDQISVLPHARPSGNVNGSQPTVTIADKYKSRRSHRDLRTTLWRAEMKRCPRGCNSIRSCR